MSGIQLTQLQSLVDSQCAFILYSTAEILYSGRANSILALGNYLILYKNDKSVSIHGGTNIQPRNYMGAKASVSFENDTLTFTLKKETVKVNIKSIISCTILNNWSDNKIELCKTEKELSQKIVNNWNSYFNDQFTSVLQEYQTPLGPIDIIGFTSDAEYIIEVKRKTATIKDITQLLRYIEARRDICKQIHGYIACPSISQRALQYLNQHRLNYLYVDFDK